MILSPHTFLHPRRGGTVILAAAVFAFGMIVGAVIAPEMSGRKERAGTAAAGEPAVLHGPAAVRDGPHTLRAAHPAQVVRILDGDTFEARVGVWPGIEITTKVRLRGIDAPELRARCADEFAKAQAARDALAAILAEGAVGISRVTLDKYGGRVVADASTGRTADVSAALLRAGHARSYQGGRRESWCGLGTAASRP
jgi:endonuclease YncB( thermonuclease family)